MEELRSRGYCFSCLANLYPKHVVWCYRAFLLVVVSFLPGKYNLLHKMVPAKQKLRKFASNYHLLNVTNDLQMLPVMCSLFLSKMGFQLWPFKRKPRLAIEQEQSVQLPKAPGLPMPCHRALRVTTLAHTESPNEVWN